MKPFILPLAIAFMAFSCGSSKPETPEEPEQPETPVSDYAQKASLTKEETALYSDELITHWKDSVVNALQESFQNKVLKMGSYSMRVWWTFYGTLPKDGRPLYISLHGGGGTTPSTNDQQWNNQKTLYKPTDAVYLCPRAITNTWDLHFVPEADAFYEEIIHYAVAAWEVNPNKVYLMGYSAGGDGVWRLAPRMADHWAAASMMAGHPGDVRLEGLRNTPFMIWCGADDSAYNRNEECAKRIKEMDALQAADPEGYIHEGHIVEGKGHWMDLEDAAAVPWMAQYARNPYPQRVVWCQGDVMKEAFYWLGAPLSEAKKGMMVAAHIDKAANTVVIEDCDYPSLTIYLNDNLVDLDKPVKVVKGGKVLFEGSLTRSPKSMRASLNARQDIGYIFPAQVTVTL